MVTMRFHDLAVVGGGGKSIVTKGDEREGGREADAHIDD